jgi:hypothetical protein
LKPGEVIPIPVAESLGNSTDDPPRCVVAAEGATTDIVNSR